MTFIPKDETHDIEKQYFIYNCDAKHDLIVGTLDEIINYTFEEKTSLNNSPNAFYDVYVF